MSDAFSDIPPIPNPPPLIYGKIAAALAEVEAVGKDHRNPQQGYVFRSIDDFYDHVQPVLSRHRIFIAPTILEHTREERATKAGGVMMTTLCKVRFRIFAEDGSFIEADALGEGADSGDKSANKSASMAMKYMLQQVFCIRVNGEQNDTEHASPQYQPRPAAPKNRDHLGFQPSAAAPPKQYDLKPAEPRRATEKTREWMFANLPLDLSAFRAAKGWSGEWPLEHVPTNKAALGELVREIETFLKESAPQPAPEKPSAAEFSEPFWNAVVTVPRARMKRAEYLLKPDTIKSLYVAAKAGDEDSRVRLWGLAKEWTPQEWVGQDGQLRPPNAADVECRKNLDLFLQWHEQKESSK